MSFLHDVIRCFIAVGMPQNNHYYNKKRKRKFSNGKPQLGVLFEQTPTPPTHTHAHTHKHTHTHTHTD